MENNFIAMEELKLNIKHQLPNQKDFFMVWCAFDENTIVGGLRINS